AFASSAAQARPLTPEPTTTASCSGNDLPKLVVGDEAALFGAELLHGVEHLGAALLGNVEPQLVRLDPDRVEPALLAEHDRAAGRDELRRVGLDRRRVVELARDGARLAPVEGVAGDRLPGLELVAGQLADALGDAADQVETETGLDPVERAQRQRDLAE